MLSACLLFGSLATPASAILLCGSPGASGPGSPTGIINDYWPGSGSPGSGSSSITLGSRRAGGGGSDIAIGDLVLIIQVQDADINSTNTSSYGDGGGSGAGATNVNGAGLYEYVLATNSVGAGGGVLTFTPALTNSYRTRNYTAGSNGQSRWQAVRVPQYSSATASNVTALAWDGNSGGIVAMDVENALTLGGATAIDVSGLGFHGGAGRVLGGAAGTLDTDFRTLATTTTNAGKGEGIAGTPRYINNTSAYNAAPNVTDTTVEGYPNGSYARGAPGNAGGGGTDGNPTANDQNTGGGGGSNYGFGGQGGDAWNSGDPSGGRGGGPFSSILASNRVFLGGGGGAGTTNNATGDAATYSAPPGVGCTSGAACSSGAAGGGIILIRAGSISGSGAIRARGADAYNVQNDGAGGGGGGGTVVLQSYFGGSATVDVSGGNGGNAWRSRNTLIDRHGPGGGGGGGFIAYSPSTGFAVTASYDAGLSGLSSNDDPFGSTSGTGGLYTFDLPSVPGIQPGTFCPPAIKAVALAVDNGAPGAVDPGDTVEYTVVYRNGSSGAISGFNITDALPADVNFVAGSLNITTSGGATGSANGAYDGSTNTTLLASNTTLPAGGIITATLRGIANAPICTDVLNQANSVQDIFQDVLGLTDNADSTQNEGGLPAGSYFDQTPYGTGGATDQTGFPMGCPNLITSTKSWVDLNGGDQEPGDTLRYTITVIDSGGGEATGVTVTDDIPLNLTSFNLVSIPTGATSSWDDIGGTYGNGLLTVTGITVPAGGSVEVVFDVNIDSAASSGTTIDNSAIATNPLGPDGTPSAPTVTVTDSFTPITGNKNLYLYDDTSSPQYMLSRTPPSGLTGYVNLTNAGGSQTWALSPVLASDVTTLGSNVTAYLWLTNNTTAPRTRSVEARLACSSDPTTYASSGTLTFNNVPAAGAPTSYTFDLTGNLPMTCTAGNSWQLTVFNRTPNNNRYVYVYAMSGTNTSYVDLPSQNVINVDSIDYFDAAYPAGSAITSVAPGAPVYIRAVVSDPFGSFDINANPPATLPTVTITDSSGTTVITSAAMTELGALTTAGTKTFEALYNVPAAGPSGNWTVRVDAVEGTEGTVSDYGNGTLPVQLLLPSLTFLKSSQVERDPFNSTTAPQAIPGGDLLYTLMVSNFGPGSVDSDTLVFDDPIPANTRLFVNDLGQGSPVLFSDSDGDSGFTPPQPFTLSYYSDAACTSATPLAPDADGFDANVRCMRINMTGSFSGAAGAVTPDFSLTFRARIE